MLGCLNISYTVLLVEGPGVDLCGNPVNNSLCRSVLRTCNRVFNGVKAVFIMLSHCKSIHCSIYI